MSAEAFSVSTPLVQLKMKLTLSRDERWQKRFQLADRFTTRGVKECALLFNRSLNERMC